MKKVKNYFIFHNMTDCEVSSWFLVCKCVFFFLCIFVATAPQVIVPDSKLIQHMNASGITVRLEHGTYVGFTYLI